MKVKVLSFLLSFVMIVTLLSGCGASSENNTSEEQTAASNQEVTTSAETKADSSSTTNDNTNKKKKVYVFTEDTFVSRMGAHKNILAALEKGGYNKGNSEIIEVNIEGDTQKVQSTIEDIKKLKPDVVALNGANHVLPIAKALKGTDIPTVMNLNLENKEADFIDANDMPKSNITGLYTMPKDIRFKAFDFLKKIAPLKTGQKAVFITVDGFFTKDDISANLKKAGVELKDYCESKYAEDFLAAVKKYNDDPEVGWILVGVWPTTKKDNSPIPMTEMAKLDIANRKKPSVTFWSAAADFGILACLGVNLEFGGEQVGNMMVRILKGEKVQSIKVEEPKKINIEINKKRADMLGISLPPEVLGGASKVYDKTILDSK